MSWDSWFAPIRERFGSLSSMAFRVDAGRLPGLSFGHLERCTILSRLLRGHGVQTRFFMKDIREGVERAKELGEDVRIIDGDWMSELATYQGLVVDLPYEPEVEVVAHCEQGGAQVLFIDDSGRDLFSCDTVLNYGVLAVPEAYPRATHHLLGTEYLLVDEVFQEALALAGKSDGALVLTFGGSDPTGLTRHVLSALLAHDLHGLRLSAILGPGFDGGDDLLEKARLSEGRLTVLKAPKELLPILARSSAVICAGGKTLYECVRLGKPTLAIGTTDHEAMVVQGFSQKTEIVIGMDSWNEKLFQKSFNRLINKIAHD